MSHPSTLRPCVVLLHPTINQPPVPTLPRRLTPKQMRGYGVVNLEHERRFRQQRNHAGSVTPPDQVPIQESLEYWIGRMQAQIHLAEEKLRTARPYRGDQ